MLVVFMARGFIIHYKISYFALAMMMLDASCLGGGVICWEKYLTVPNWTPSLVPRTLLGENLFFPPPSFNIGNHTG